MNFTRTLKKIPLHHMIVCHFVKVPRSIIKVKGETKKKKKRKKAHFNTPKKRNDK
jgi:hypothetical protein